MRLLDYSANVYSQYGEDGILAKALELLPLRDKWCVEFGAWDGRYLSNTCSLIERHGYSSVLIEPDKSKFDDLVKHHANNRKVRALSRFVGYAPDDNLDHILSEVPIPKDFDLLSIDIDGNDYHVWGAMSIYEPKIVCIEFNPTIPTEVDFVQPADATVKQGASLLALTRLAREKGYELVCATHNNGVFVRAAHFPLFGIVNNSPLTLREDLSAITYLFAGYDGTLLVSGREGLPHHRGIRIQRRIRQLPKVFRAYPPDLGPSARFFYKFYWRAARLFRRA